MIFAYIFAFALILTIPIATAFLLVEVLIKLKRMKEGRIEETLISLTLALLLTVLFAYIMAIITNDPAEVVMINELMQTYGPGAATAGGFAGIYAFVRTLLVSKDVTYMKEKLDEGFKRIDKDFDKIDERLDSLTKSRIK